MANKFSFEARRVATAVSHRVSFALSAYATSINFSKLHIAMLRRLASYKKFALVGLSLSLSEAFMRAPQEVARVVEPKLLTVESHWQRVTGIIASALESFQRVKTLHAAAARQLDATDYALNQLLLDLRPVMGLPADVSGLRAVLAEAERTAPERYRNALAA